MQEMPSPAPRFTAKRFSEFGIRVSALITATEFMVCGVTTAPARTP